MAWTHIDAIIKNPEENITLSFWEAMKQYDITPFDSLIVFLVTLHNTQRLHPTS